MPFQHGRECETGADPSGFLKVADVKGCVFPAVAEGR